MKNKILLIKNLYTHFGFKWIIFRLFYYVRLRLGLLRIQIPVIQWSSTPFARYVSDRNLLNPQNFYTYRLQKAPHFFFQADDRLEYSKLFPRWDKDGCSAVSVSDEISKGIFTYFSHTKKETGFPPDWFNNPFTFQNIPSDIHWSQISDFAFGDIKIIWEPSRFSFVYHLVRAYWRTGDEKYPEIFWKLVEDWREKNPPQIGPNWKCGQEISFRVMAWCFGLYGFLKSSASTPERIQTFAHMIAVSGERIEKNISYALSQNNNHGISEGLGLWTIGLLFPEFKRSCTWCEKGRKILEKLGQILIYDDGAFSQHSMNYHRLMLHDYLWCIRLGDINQQPLSDELKKRVCKAGDFLYQIQDPITGRVPNYGANDGALILSLNNCDYTDYRPVVQAVRYLCTGKRYFNSGPWDEDLLWLFGTEALNSPVVIEPREELQAETGGYYTLRSSDSFVFIRCATFRHRPAHADLLHVDLWWKGHNVALDPGTYSYNAPEPWNNALSGTAFHNTITIDGCDQMKRVGRFLWLPWLKGKIVFIGQSPGNDLSYWEGMHDGYARLPDPIMHKRGIMKLPNEHWLILDKLTGRSEHDYDLHWLFPDVPYQWNQDSGLLSLEFDSEIYNVMVSASEKEPEYAVTRASEKTPVGWYAPYYYEKKAALSLTVKTRSQSTTFWTIFGPERCNYSYGSHKLELETFQWKGIIKLNDTADDSMPIIASASIYDQKDRTWEIHI